VTYWNGLQEISLPPLLLLGWKNFATRCEGELDFLLLNVGPQVTGDFCNIKPQERWNIGHFIDYGMQYALQNQYDVVAVCEGDCFWLKEDLLQTFKQFEVSGADYAIPNNRTGWIIKPNRAVREVQRLDHNYHAPWGHLTPSTGIIIMTTDFYQKFLSVYQKLFGNKNNPMASETITFFRFCEMIGVDRTPDVPDEVVKLDAFIRANAWVTFLVGDFKRGLLFNYDGRSFRCKTEYDLNYANFSSILEAVDQNNMPDAEGKSLIGPFFHLGWGTSVMRYFAPTDSGINGVHQKALGQRSRVDTHYSLCRYLTDELRHPILAACLSKDPVDADYAEVMIDFYKPAFVDYLKEKK